MYSIGFFGPDEYGLIEQRKFAIRIDFVESNKVAKRAGLYRWGRIGQVDIKTVFKLGIENRPATGPHNRIWRKLSYFNEYRSFCFQNCKRIVKHYTAETAALSPSAQRKTANFLPHLAHVLALVFQRNDSLLGVDVILQTAFTKSA